MAALPYAGGGACAGAGAGAGACFDMLCGSVPRDRRRRSRQTPRVAERRAVGGEQFQRTRLKVATGRNFATKASAGYLPEVRSFTRHGGKPGAAADGAAQKGMCLSRPCLPRWPQRMPARMANAKTEAWGEW